MQNITIDFISDVVCPWCAVAYKRLEKAIEKLGLQNFVVIIWHPYELNPNMPAIAVNEQEYKFKKYGRSFEEQKKWQENMAEIGKTLNFTFDFFPEMVKPNSFEAHILIDYAKDFDKQTELNMHLAANYFSERKDISKREILKQALINVGLKAKQGMQRLDDPIYREKIKTHESKWINAGIHSVPTLIFNQKKLITGAQSINTYQNILSEWI